MRLSPFDEKEGIGMGVDCCKFCSRNIDCDMVRARVWRSEIKKEDRRALLKEAFEDISYVELKRVISKLPVDKLVCLAQVVHGRLYDRLKA